MRREKQCFPRRQVLLIEKIIDIIILSLFCVPLLLFCVKWNFVFLFIRHWVPHFDDFNQRAHYLRWNSQLVPGRILTENKHRLHQGENRASETHPANAVTVGTLHHLDVGSKTCN